MSIVLTKVQDFIQKNPGLDKFEDRINNLGAYDAFKRQSMSPNGLLSNDLKQAIFQSMGKTVKTPVYDNKGVTIRSTRPLTIPIDENTSTFATYTFTTLAYGWHMYPNLYHNNELGYQEDWNKKMMAGIVGFSDSLETLALAKIDANKTQVIPQVPGGHTFASNVVSETGIGTLKDSYILNDLPGMLRSMRMYNSALQTQSPINRLDIVANNYYEGILNRMQGFGVYNQENKTLPMGNKNFHFTSNLSNASGKAATGYAIADNCLGMMTRVERPALYGSSTKDGHEWGTVRLPLLDIEVGTYYYEGAVDAATAIGTADAADMTRDVVQVFDFAFDVCFVTVYNSDPTTIPNPIIKFDISTS